MPPTLVGGGGYLLASLGLIRMQLWDGGAQWQVRFKCISSMFGGVTGERMSFTPRRLCYGRSRKVNVAAWWPEVSSQYDNAAVNEGALTSVRQSTQSFLEHGLSDSFSVGRRSNFCAFAEVRNRRRIFVLSWRWSQCSTERCEIGPGRTFPGKSPRVFAQVGNLHACIMHLTLWPNQ